MICRQWYWREARDRFVEAKFRSEARFRFNQSIITYFNLISMFIVTSFLPHYYVLEIPLLHHYYIIITYYYHNNGSIIAYYYNHYYLLLPLLLPHYYSLLRSH